MKKSMCFITLLALAMFAKATNFTLENFDYLRYNAERQHSYERIPIANLDSLMSCYSQSNLERGTRTIFSFATPAIGDQGNLNSCVSWALCYAGVSIRLYNFWTADWNESLCSPAFLFNQYKTQPDPTDCHSAYLESLGALADSLNKYGVCTYAMMPYDSTDCTTMPTIAQRINALNKRFSPVRFEMTNNVSTFKAIIDVLESPIIVGMPMYTSFRSMWNDTTSHGVWSTIDTTSYELGLWHATCIVGYDDSREAFKVMNSWGDSLGDHGFYWAKYSVVEQGAFREAIALTTRDSAQIEGSSYFCSNEECYQLTNTPSGCTYTWSINSNVYPNDVISSGQGTTNVCISQQGLSPRSGNDTDENINQKLPRLNFPRSVLSVTISDPANTQSYSVSKSIYDPSPKPTVSASNTATNWTAGTTRTFTITNCNSVSYTNLQWVIQKTVNNFGGNSTIYTDTIYGTYMTYTPTWVTGALSITIDITATNLARHCEDNYVHLSYNVIRKHLLNAIDNGSLLDVTISDEETTSLLKQTTSNEKNLYTLELWHPIYGQMRKQPAYSTNEQININGLPQGTYILLLKKDYEIIAQTKVIIQ